MRALLKFLALLIVAPIALALLGVLAIAAMIAVPILWEVLIARFTAPPPEPDSTT